MGYRLQSQSQQHPLQFPAGQGAHILILDEPMSGVDIDGMKLLLDMLDEIRTKYDLSILMSTHDFTMLDPYVDKVLLLNDTIQAAGTPRVVLNSDAFREAFHLGQEWRAK